MLVLQYPLAWCSSGCLGGVVVECVTSGETGLLVTLGELDVEVGDQRVDVVVPLDLQAEGGGEGQVLGLHRVDVHLLGLAGGGGQGGGGGGGGFHHDRKGMDSS